MIVSNQHISRYARLWHNFARGDKIFLDEITPQRVKTERYREQLTGVNDTMKSWSSRKMTHRFA